MNPLTFAEDVEQRRRAMLPMALSQGGTLSSSVQPGQALPMTMRQRLSKAYQDLDALESQDVDTSALQAFARQQGEQGQTAMLNALAAQYAGESFQPVQAQFLKRAAAAQEPMKVGGGMLTPGGEFIKDPFASRDARRAALERQALGLERMVDSSERAERERQDRLQRQSEISQLGWFNANTARMSANNAGGNKAPAGYQWSTAPDGSPALTFIPGGPADPQTKAAGAPTEDERKAAGWFFQADLARRNMETAVKNTPGASMPTIGERGLSMIPGIGEDIANAMRPEDRQRFLQAASSFAEATLRAATGAGVNRDEAMQKVRELTPQIGDRPGTIKQKIDAQQMYLESLRTRAGRAFPQGGQPTQPGAAPVDDPLGLRR